MRLIENYSDRYIHKIEKFPDNLDSLYISGSKTIPKLPKNLKVLEINSCWMSELPTFPEKLECLNINNMDIKTITNLPDGLEELDLNELHYLDKIVFPENLVQLSIRRTGIYDIPYLGKLKLLQLSKQRIYSIYLNDNTKVNVVKDVDFYGPIYVGPNFDFTKNFGGCCAPDVSELEIERININQ